MGEYMRLCCIASSFAFILFFGLIGIFVLPSLLIYFLYYYFVDYPEDKFQKVSSIIYKIFYFSVPRIELKSDLLDDLPQSAIYVSTHQSNLDYPILGSFIDRYIIMTSMNFKKIPFISLIGNLIGIRYLNRSNLNEISTVYDEFNAMLQNDRNVVFFAEGTRQSGKKLGNFKRGAFRLAVIHNKPIIPIIISGSAKILSKGNFCFSTIKHTYIYVQMLEPIYPNKFVDENDMLEYTQNIMQEQSTILNNKGR